MSTVNLGRTYLYTYKHTQLSRCGGVWDGVGWWLRWFRGAASFIMSSFMGQCATVFCAQLRTDTETHGHVGGGGGRYTET